jgi:cytoskeletal protein RodZ
VSAPPGRCPRCHSELAPGQDWCTTCGYAATTRILPPGNWRVPIIVVTVIFLLGLGGVAAAFVAVSDDASEVTTTTLPPRTLPATGTAPTASTPTASTASTTTPTTSTPTASTPTSTTTARTTTAATAPDVQTATTPATK